MCSLLWVSVLLLSTNSMGDFCTLCRCLYTQTFLGVVLLEQTLAVQFIWAPSRLLPLLWVEDKIIAGSWWQDLHSILISGGTCKHLWKVRLEKKPQHTPLLCPRNTHPKIQNKHTKPNQTKKPHKSKQNPNKQTPKKTKSQKITQSNSTLKKSPWVYDTAYKKVE